MPDITENSGALEACRRKPTGRGLRAPQTVISGCMTKERPFNMSPGLHMAGRDPSDILEGRNCACQDLNGHVLIFFEGTVGNIALPQEGPRGQFRGVGEPGFFLQCLWVLRFPPTVQRHAARETGDAKLPPRCECVWV